METIFIYLLKSSGLIAIFYLSYYFLVQKETFFNSNRWFLLSGLLTSVLLPLFFIKKVVLIQETLMFNENLSNSESIRPSIMVESIDWDLVFLGIYLLISFVFIVMIVSNLYSLFKLINKKKILINKPFAMVDINENINPFSFFKYIVFNSKLYSKPELESILKHEKVHSREKHSIDVLVIRVFCSIFWFNPFIWWYKKAILQNLEYIADQKAIENIEDKKAYQMTLLRVVSDQNCLSITNNFYQSLIKKRIVMLNKNQSKKWNSWKYAIVLPVLMAFVLCFQVKVIAQEKTLSSLKSAEKNTIETAHFEITKDNTDAELKKYCETAKENYNVDLEILKIKRNAKNEIIAITMRANDNKGSKSTHEIEGDEPILPFQFLYKKDEKGKGEFGFYNSNIATINNENGAIAESVSKQEYLGALNELAAPEAPEAPEMPEMPEMNNMPTPPPAPNFPPAPRVQFPKNSNDKKAIKKYEAEMEKYTKKLEISNIKKYDADMKKYESEMAAYQPDMTAYEKEMKKYEAKMEAYQEKMQAYQEKIRDENQNDQEAARDEIEAKRDEIQSRRDEMNAKRDEMNAKRDVRKAKINVEINKKRTIN